jgi:hypothetical protein
MVLSARGNTATSCNNAVLSESPPSNS